MSRLLVVIAAAMVVVGPAVRAQTPVVSVQLSPEAAVALALEHNLDLKRDRFGPQIADLDVRASATAWTPQLTASVGRTSSEAPSTSTFDQAQIAAVGRTLASSAAVDQRLPWGATYRVGWDNARRTSNSALARFQPELRAGAAVSFIQPLLKGLTFDAARADRQVSVRGRDIARAELEAAVASTKQQVLRAYWAWVFARDFLNVQRQSLALAEALLEGNRGRVAAGAMAAVDIIEAQAEVARRSEAIIVAEKEVANSEDDLRLLILDPDAPGDPFEPAADALSDDQDAVPAASAVARALEHRQDLKILRTSLDIDAITLRRLRNETLPDVSLRADYALQGTGGTELLRAQGFAGPITGSLQRSFASVLDDVVRSRYPTWSVELAVSYPIGTARADVDAARTVLEQQRAAADLRAAEQRVATEVRNVSRDVDANRRRLATTTTAVSLSERRLDAEQRKFAVGLSTSFFVFQAQRDLAQAREAHLRAVLDYRVSRADFDAVQTIPVHP